MRVASWLCIAALGCSAMLIEASPAHAQASPPLPRDFAHLRAVDSSIIQDIRYATPRNFMAARVPGYEAGECILLRKVADALKLVQDDLWRQNLALKVYDCYRPMRAVNA